MRNSLIRHFRPSGDPEGAKTVANPPAAAREGAEAAAGGLGLPSEARGEAPDEGARAGADGRTDNNNNRQHVRGGPAGPRLVPRA